MRSSPLTAMALLACLGLQMDGHALSLRAQGLHLPGVGRRGAAAGEKGPNHVLTHGIQGPQNA